MPPHFRIVIVRPPGYAHSEAFREVADTLQHALTALGATTRIEINQFDPGATNIVLGWLLLEEATAIAMPVGTILYNLEQLSGPDDPLIRGLIALATRATIWEYSLHNLRLLREAAPSVPFRHVPIGFMPEMARIESAPVQDIDVLFYGSLNERRRAVLAELHGLGVNVKAVVGVYGPARDALISRSKVVLNLHYYDAQIFEMVRVSYLLANRKAVVAEFAAGTELLPEMHDAMVLAPYDQLASACVALLQDPRRRAALEARGFEIMSSFDQARILAEALTTADARPAREAPPPAVSIVVITLNRPRFLKRALQSIQEQTFRDFEVLVVNDGGEDISGITDAFAAQGLKIRAFRQAERRGQSAARNIALRHARGRWIAYLDDDDLYYPDHLQTLVETLERSGAKVAYTDSMRAVEEERDGEWQVLTRELAMSIDFDRNRLLLENITPINNVMHERSCWVVEGPHDETLPVLEDWDYWIRLSRRWDFVHVPKATAEVRWRSTGANTTFEQRGLFPIFRLRIAEKVASMLQREAIAAAPAVRQAFLHEPDWSGAEWVEVLLSYVHAFRPGEPVALILLMDPVRPGQLPLAQAQQLVASLIRQAGKETFADVILANDPSTLLQPLRAFDALVWVPKGMGNTQGLSGQFGSRLARARQELAKR